MLLTFTHSTTGLIHVLFASVAMIAGALVLFLRKGTPLHFRIGYVYTTAMTGMLVTSFMIYHLYQSFALFHWLAVVSSLTLFGGMIPVFLKKPRNYLGLHIAFMYWSVVGLYMAFCAETAVRIPREVVAEGQVTGTFYAIVGVSMAILGVVANVFWFRYKRRWTEEFLSAKTAVPTTRGQS